MHLYHAIRTFLPGTPASLGLVLQLALLLPVWLLLHGRRLSTPMDAHGLGPPEIT